MKRTEMLQAIRNKLHGTYMNHDNFEEQILECVEQLGMLPPVHYFDIAEVHPAGTFYRRENLNMWESENDK